MDEPMSTGCERRESNLRTAAHDLDPRRMPTPARRTGRSAPPTGRLLGRSGDADRDDFRPVDATRRLRLLAVFFELPGDLVPREAVLDEAPAGQSEPTALLGTLQEMDHRAGELVGIVCKDGMLARLHGKSFRTDR